MLISTIREKVSGWIVWAIVGLICVAFALFGIEQYLDGLNRVVVAKVNGEEIDYDTYQRALSNRQQQMRQVFGGRVDQSMFSTSEFKTQTVEGLVSDRLIAADVRDSGYRISDAQLANLIQDFPTFKDTDGNFSKQLYEDRLRSQGLSPQGFEQIQRQQNAIDQIRNGFVNSAFITEKELTRMIALAEEVRDTDVALIPFERFADEVEVTEDEAKAEFDDNQETYRAPARGKFQFVELSVDKLLTGVTVSEDDVKAAYEANKAQYLAEERRQARHILVKLAEDADADTDKDAFEKAKGLIEKLNGGSDFAELAKENSEDTGSAASGGDLGLVNRGVMVKPFEDALFSMDAGAISEEPVRSRFGYHIIKLEDIQAEQVKPYDDVRDEIEQEQKRLIAADRFAELAENFRNVVFEQPDQLDSAADEIEVEVNTTDWVTTESGTGHFSNPQLRALAFGDEVINEDLNSEVFEIDVDTLVAVRKVEYEESRIQNFEEAKADAEANAKRRKQEEAAKALGDKVIERVKGGETWEEVLADIEVVPVKGPTKRREASATPVNRALAETIFELEAPAEDAPGFGGESVLGTNYAVYRVNSVAAGDAEKVDDTAREQLSQRLQRRLGDEVFLSYQTGLRDRADVTLLESNILDDTLGYNHSGGRM